MVSPSTKRRAVQYIQQEGLGSKAQACRALGLARSGAYRQPQGSKKGQKLRRKIVALSRKHPRYGYRRITALMRRGGYTINPKRVQRIRRQEGFQVRKRQRRTRRLGSGMARRQQANKPGHVWSWDFVEDQTENGSRIRILTLIDEFTRQCLAMHVAWSIRAVDVIRVVEAAMKRYGRPLYIRSDNGPEFIADAIQKWLEQKQVDTLYIEPGAPWENGHIESFHDKLRDEFLNREIFATLLEAKVLAEQWRVEYNQQRPHSSLGYKTPEEFAGHWQTPLRATPSTASASVEPTMNQRVELYF